MQVKVFITPRKGILDPQGRAVEQALKTLGFNQIADVRVGRYIVLEVAGASAAGVREAAKKMCEQLLANPLIEDYRFEVGAE
ncbi:MAG: phosphoribosylformylglycinamidine synthase subunit PurS [Candidatus Binataceae bacterium]|nr:phosphoribosylformylglycinamidine synthase subunit PurS [Candidatus Binataceae bacterium]